MINLEPRAEAMSRNSRPSETRPGRYLFYRFDWGQPRPANFPQETDFTVEMWEPHLLRPWPPGVALKQRLHFSFRTALHVAGRFAPSESGALLMSDGARAVHYSAFTPRYWRFPFLEKCDLQVGDTWTHPSYRGRGLAKTSLRRLVSVLSQPGRTIWYVVDEVNQASIKVAEGCGFHLGGTGARIRRPMGLDYYQLLIAQSSDSGPSMQANGGGRLTAH